ncbi:hypothetical protein [uncultured Thiodictyon sp.]|uniref:hypothetical protein n=1 Tax=uncultured Thiodictyon sp. TaxID=1846217 RepID=UPI0025CB7B61|nr:hypothetical protein [uncultured Thiodictyon sp.]
MNKDDCPQMNANDRQAFRTGGRGFSRIRAAEMQCRPAKASTSYLLAAEMTAMDFLHLRLFAFICGQ